MVRPRVAGVYGTWRLMRSHVAIGRACCVLTLVLDMIVACWG